MTKTTTTVGSKNEMKTESILDGIIDNTGTKVCFICTGNTCRSPMAAAVLNEYGAEFGFCASSAGIIPQVGAPISKNAVFALESSGIKSTEGNDYKNHRARAATEEYLSGFDKIVCVSQNHELLLKKNYPSLSGKITSFAGDISDPYGQAEHVYIKCLSEIKEQVFRIFHLDD